MEVQGRSGAQQRRQAMACQYGCTCCRGGGGESMLHQCCTLGTDGIMHGQSPHQSACSHLILCILLAVCLGPRTRLSWLHSGFEGDAGMAAQPTIPLCNGCPCQAEQCTPLWPQTACLKGCSSHLVSYSHRHWLRCSPQNSLYLTQWETQGLQ